MTTTTLLVLVGILVVAGYVGYRQLTAPLPGGTDAVASTCEDVSAGDLVRAEDVTVSVFNAGSRAGLAGKTQTQLTGRGFIPGDLGNAPDDLAKVRFVRVLAPRTDDPAARLVASQFGPSTLLQRSDTDLGPGVDVVVGDRFSGLRKGAPKQLLAQVAGSGC